MSCRNYRFVLITDNCTGLTKNDCCAGDTGCMFYSCDNGTNTFSGLCALFEKKRTPTYILSVHCLDILFYNFVFSAIFIHFSTLDSKILDLKWHENFSFFLHTCLQFDVILLVGCQKQNWTGEGVCKQGVTPTPSCQDSKYIYFFHDLFLN